MTIPLLNASGCLDPLTAPDVARSLDVVVTKTITPLPRAGNPPVRIAETEHGMLNSIGLQGPGIDAFARGEPAAARGARGAALGLGRRLLGGRLRALLRAPRRGRPDRRDRAEPVVPERRGGARDGGRARRRGARGDVQDALREALAGAMGHRRVGARGGRGGRRRAVAREHDPRVSRSIRSRCDHGSRRGVGGYSGPASDRSRSPASTRARRRSTCRSWAWAVSSRARDAVELAAVGASAVALGTVLFADPLAPARIRAEIVPEVAALGSEGLPANRARLLSI